ncbi:putative conserved membrane protein [Mycobacterium kansasii]|uniref:Putative conserved membrane protein n=1 Tax=Mycobacterium kansasii TaxID=1768 RepID=A0A1V3WN95_MYCKA|nr:putative conserved membrane protein [Mycobacterium kansasii]
MENIADFVSAYIIGNLLQMAFRFWAFRRWVFPDEFAATRTRRWNRPDRRWYRRGLGGHPRGRQRHPAARLRSKRSRTGRLAQLGASSEPRVSKTS